MFMLKLLLLLYLELIKKSSWFSLFRLYCK